MTTVQVTRQKFSDTLRVFVLQALQDPCLELEMRFSTQTGYAPGAPAEILKPEGYKFKPGVDRNLFFKARDQFAKAAQPCDWAIEHSIVTDHIGPDGERETQTKDAHTGGGSVMIKRKLKTFDFWEFGCRATLNRETYLDGVTKLGMKTEYIRHKDRVSFVGTHVRFDFTVATSSRPFGNTRPSTSYEIEVEFTGNKRNVGQRVVSFQEATKVFVDGVFLVLHVLQQYQTEQGHPQRQQNVPNLIKVHERHNTLLEYNVLTRNSIFIGAQPETFHRHHLKGIANQEYAVSEKYDGERWLLFVSDTAQCFLINRSMAVKKTGLRAPGHKGTLMDVEVVNETFVYAFDMLFHQGRDLRADPDEPLRCRLAKIKRVVDSINREQEAYFSLHTKEYTFGNAAVAGLLQEDQSDRERNRIQCDGFIFTPTHDPYPNRCKWPTLLKWKPAEINTIDFACRPSKTHPGQLDLLVVDADGVYVPFPPSPRTMEKKGINSNVIECVWSGTHFIPWRCRYDKQHPNFIGVALDVWQSICDPVSISCLTKELNSKRQGVSAEDVMKFKSIDASADLVHLDQLYESESAWTNAKWNTSSWLVAVALDGLSVYRAHRNGNSIYPVEFDPRMGISVVRSCEFGIRAGTRNLVFSDHFLLRMSKTPFRLYDTFMLSDMVKDSPSAKYERVFVFSPISDDGDCSSSERLFRKEVVSVVNVDTQFPVVDKAGHWALLSASKPGLQGILYYLEMSVGKKAAPTTVVSLDDIANLFDVILALVPFENGDPAVLDWARVEVWKPAEYLDTVRMFVFARDDSFLHFSVLTHSNRIVQNTPPALYAVQ
ncbi:hypothetical protein HDU80_000907 [Chytriomyces hyalinus]|nr:hypothetical protein HDU80_000907 [Chytriomyces hyalinus]